MKVKIQDIEENDSVYLSKKLLEAAQMNADDEVEVTINCGRIIIESAAETAKHISLAKLVAEMPEDYKPVELDWGKPVGKEVW